MATYRLSVKVMSRSTGRSSVAAAAYRAAEKILDVRLNQTFDYERKQGVDHTEILAPNNAPVWATDRAKLWNAVEQIEKRKDAQVAREIQLSLPKEFSPTQNIKLVQDFTREHFVAKSMIADIALHHLREHNPHAHIMLTTRRISTDGFGRKERTWNQKQLLQDWRKAWEVHLNTELQRAGIDQIVDSRSFEDQGINLESQHIGCAAHHMHANGETGLDEVEKLKRIQRDNGERIIHDPNVALVGITKQQATFTERDLARFINKRTVDSEQFDRAFTLARVHENLVRLGKDNRGVMRFTSLAMLETEKQLFAHVATLENTGHPVRPKYLTQAKAQRPSLSNEQNKALDYLTTQGDIKCLVGIAGSGKSFLLNAARDTWEAAGYRVKGAALSGIVAQSLGLDAGIEQSRTIASWQYQWAQGRLRLNERDVLILDEAGLVGTRQMESVLDEVNRAKAKLVLVGDAAQLQAIEAGAAFRGITQATGFTELTTVRRQVHDWQREATQELAQGHTQRALLRLVEHGRIHFEADKAQAHRALIDAWEADKEADHSRVILAHTRADIASLNALAREKLIETGELDRGRSYALENGARDLSFGETVVFLKNDNGLGVKNGTRGTVLSVSDDGMLGVQVGDRSMHFSTEDYNHLDYGYALTVHKAQGLTVDKSYVYASRGFDKHLSYVSLSRHREEAKLFADNQTFDGYHDMVKCLSRSREKDLVQDYAHNRSLEPQIGPYSDLIAQARQIPTPNLDLALESVYERLSAKVEEHQAAAEKAQPKTLESYLLGPDDIESKSQADIDFRATMELLAAEHGGINLEACLGKPVEPDNPVVEVEQPSTLETEIGEHRWFDAEFTEPYSPSLNHCEYVRDALKGFEVALRDSDLANHPFVDNHPEIFPEEAEKRLAMEQEKAELEALEKVEAEKAAEQQMYRRMERDQSRENDYEIEM